MVLFILGDGMNVLVIGGDFRMNVAIDELKKSGYKVDSLGLTKNDCGKICDADVILLPVPTTRDGINIFCPQSDKIIPLDYINEAKESALILSCGYTFKGQNCVDYLNPIDEKI